MDDQTSQDPTPPADVSPSGVSSQLLEEYDLRDRLQLTADAIRKSRSRLLAYSSVVIPSLVLGIVVDELWILFAFWPSYFVWDHATQLRARQRERRALREALSALRRGLEQ